MFLYVSELFFLFIIIFLRNTFVYITQTPPQASTKDFLGPEGDEVRCIREATLDRRGIFSEELILPCSRVCTVYAHGNIPNVQYSKPFM